MSNVIELPNWDKKESKQECIAKKQNALNKLTIYGFKKQNKTNLKLWLAVGLLLVFCICQQIQIHQMAKDNKQIVVVDNQTDLTGLDMPPVEGLK